jgi:hypothetical protein
VKDGDPVTALYPARGGVLFEHARVQLAGSRAWAQTDKGWVRAARCRVGRDQVGSRLGRRRAGDTVAREVVVVALKTGDPVIVCGVGPLEIPTYAAVQVQHHMGEWVYMTYAENNGMFLRQIFLRNEGRIWMRGHSDDAMAALLLTRSAR